MKYSWPNILLALLGIFISMLAVRFVLLEYDFKASWQVVKNTHWLVLFSMIGVYLSTFIFRAIRWKLMLSGVGDLNFSLLIKGVIIGFAGNNLLPARGGELLRMEYFSRRTNISRMTSLASIGLEKVLDALILLLLMLIGGMYHLSGITIISDIVKVVSLIFAPVVITILVIRVKGNNVLEWLTSKSGFMAQFFVRHLSNLIRALAFINLDLPTLKVIGLSLLIWSLEAVVFMLGIAAFKVQDHLILMGVITLCMVNFGILIPSSPGYIGVFQVAFVLALSSFSVSESDSLAFSIIVHACQFFPVTFIGLTIVGLEYIRR